MCNCKLEVKPQNYKNQITMYSPSLNKEISIDRCLATEIKFLWSIGIKTTGCCCGHNVTLPFIGVENQYIVKMINLGYNIQFNSSGIENFGRMDSFYPKTIEINYEQYNNYYKHLDKIIERLKRNENSNDCR